jgi:acyl-CoA thioester hydrolase
MHPIIFEIFVEVETADIDELGHVNNVNYFHYLQKAAMAHWYSSVPLEISDAIRWVVKKHEIEYFKPAFAGQKLKILTWIEHLKGLSSERKYEIYYENSLLVKAKTLWISVDPKSLKPKRLPTNNLESFFMK